MVTEGFREPLINLCFKKEQTFESPHIRDSQDSIRFWDSYIYPQKVDSMFLQLKEWKLQRFAQTANGRFKMEFLKIEND